MSTRRNFIQVSALGIAGTLARPLGARAGNSDSVTGLTTGIAGYTFAKFDLDRSIAMMKRLDMHYISVKDVHLPLNSTADKIQTVLSKFGDAGIKVYTVGVIYMKTKEAVDEAFEYAKKVGVPMIVCVPNPDLLDYTEEKVKTTGIKAAIHNHGPDDKLYPGPRSVYELIKDRDKAMGLCLDIGHATRAGEDPAKAIIAYKSRIFDLHIKDVSLAAREGKAIEMGRGIIDFTGLVNALRKIQYKGICSIEFEKDMEDPLPGIAESVGYFKGIIANGNHHHR
jgi:sugar phosphate isomerase/epimerase